MKVSYSSNNSGGHWWLKDKDWKNLEKAGWTVEWAKDNYYKKTALDSSNRWLGALATAAYKDFPTIKMAIAEWERSIARGRSAYEDHDVRVVGA